jgi:hypothetical protein
MRYLGKEERTNLKAPDGEQMHAQQMLATPTFTLIKY